MPHVINPHLRLLSRRGHPDLSPCKRPMEKYSALRFTRGGVTWVCKIVCVSPLKGQRLRRRCPLRGLTQTILQTHVTPPRVKRKALYFSIGRLHGERSGWPRRDNKRRCGLITCGITDQGLYSWSICRTASWRLQAWHHRPIWQYGLHRHTNHRTSNHRQAAAPWRHTSSSCPWYQKSEHLRS